MDYEKKYKEALERMRYVVIEPKNENMLQAIRETVFPELKEPDDEKISKEIIKYLEQTVPHNHRDEVLKSKEWIAWLEKQGEQSSLNINRECLKGTKRVQEYQDLSDWEKEFDNIASMYAHNKNQEGYNDSWYVKERAAEMLYYAKKELEKQGGQKPTDYENADIQQKDFAPKETVKEAESNLTPLERKVKDILFSFHINADDGISFDGTMAIVHNLITLCQQEQKPDWSIKEKLMLNDIIETTERSNIFKENYQRELIDWLKSLKPQPKQEWNEEDEKIALSIEQVMNCASLLNIVPDKIERIRTWLKTLKQRIGGKQ